MAPPFDFAIVGGGIVGLAAAALLDRCGYRVALIDANASTPQITEQFDLRSYALTPASFRLIDKAGAHALDRRRIAPYTDMHVWDACNNSKLRFSAASLGRESLGSMVEHSNLSVALDAACTAGNKVARFVANFQSMHDGQEVQHLQLDSGVSLTASIVLACDGAGSTVRETLPIASLARDFDQHAIIANVDFELAHGYIARQRFLEFGPLAVLPLAKPRHTAIVWTTSEAEAKHALTMSNEEFLGALTGVFAAELGAAVATSERRVFPLASSHARSYCHGRTALLGDAAHRVHPLAGQGLNLGLMDVAAIVEVFSPHDELAVKFPRNALRRFERMRRSENLAMLHATSALNRLFTQRSPWVRGLRGFAMSGVDHCEPLKAWLMLRAMGEAGDVPTPAR